MQNVLLTGPPGCGKTTAIRRVAERADDLHATGFYTQEIRQSGRRVGFEAIGLNGGSAVLSHHDFRSDRHVGRYGVKLDEFEALVRRELDRPATETGLFVVDEIGKMECFSETFVALMKQTLDGDVPVLATVARKGGGFIAEVKSRPDVELLTVTTDNRDALPEQLLRRFRDHK